MPQAGIFPWSRPMPHDHSCIGQGGYVSDLDLINKPSIDVREHGVIANNIVDDTVAFQAAIDALSAVGGCLILPRGQIRITDALNFPTDVFYKVEGQGLESIINMDAGVAKNGLMFAGTFPNKAYFILKDFTINGVANLNWGIYSTFAISKSYMENVYIKNFGMGGFYLNNNCGLLLVKCTAYSGTGTGFKIESGITTLQGCEAQEVIGYGVHAKDTPIYIYGGFYQDSTIVDVLLENSGGDISAFFESSSNTYKNADNIRLIGTSKGINITGNQMTKSAVDDVTATGVCINLIDARGVKIGGNVINPHADVAGLTGIPHIKIQAACRDIEIGVNDFIGKSFVNVVNPLVSIAAGVERIKVPFDVALAPVELTIAGGVISITRNYHKIDGQGDAADNLDTINGGVDGMELTLQAENVARIITVRDNVGNIELEGGVNATLGTTLQKLYLLYDATSGKWVERSRFTG